MDQQEPVEAASGRPHKEFGARVQRLRKERNLTQRMLAERLGRTPSWVSQVESGVFFPSTDSLTVLAGALGQEVLAATAADDRDPASAALTCYWAARVQLLYGLANAERNRDRRLRLSRIAKRLAAVASRAPESQPYVRGDRLIELSDLAGPLDRTARLLLLIELACHDPAAPYHVAYRRSAVYDQLELLVEDLRIDHGDFLRVKAAFDMPARTWPDYFDLAPIGGAYGALLALTGGGSHALLLRGRDPLGWLGWPYATGLWLVTGDQLKQGLVLQESGDERRRRSAAVAGAATGGLRDVPMVATTVFSAIFGKVELRLDQVLREASQSVGELDAEDIDAKEHMNFLVAMSLGAKWMRIEINKLVTFYLAFGDETENANVPGIGRIPTQAKAIATLEVLSRVLDDQYTAERLLSETGRHRDKGPRDELFASVGDSVHAGLKALRNLDTNRGLLTSAVTDSR